MAMQADVQIRHAPDEGRFYVERDGESLAELTYRLEGPGRAVIEHTRVSEALRGGGVARRLVDAAVAWARASGTKLVPVCTYAKAVLERDRAAADGLA
jgi:predicted GNAT family acetyltransferase